MSQRDQLVAALRALPAFRGANELDLLCAASLLDPVSTRAGAVLVREGSTARELYVVLEGRASVEIGGRRLAEVSAGDIVGEMAFLDDGIRSATVTAVTTMRLLRAGPAGVGTILSTQSAARAIANGLCRRLRRMNEELARTSP